MRLFLRADPPSWWATFQERWAAYCAECKGGERKPASTRLNSWKQDGETIARQFHSLVRPDVLREVCAYCDGPLREQSPPTIDHFLPDHQYPELAFDWGNLYPACYVCNSTHKGARCVPTAARPDLDPVDAWFEIDAETGTIGLAVEYRDDASASGKVADAIDLFGLNKSGRPEGRKRIVRQVWKAIVANDREELEALRREGVYVFVIDAVIRASRATKSADPSTK